MPRIASLLCTYLLLTAASAQAAIPIDLSTWQKRGPASNGNWTVAVGGESVYQSINGDPTFFVSDTDYLNTTLRGTITVENAGGDDDFIGFVFGFNGPATTGNDMDFLLFDWKQGTQNFGGSTALEGFALSDVNGTITNYIPGFWGHADSAGFDVLATNYSESLGWVAGITYDFEILYQANRFMLTLAGGAFGTGQTIFDVAGTFDSGKFGFYNYSQQGVRYAGLTEEDTPVSEVPEPTTLAMLGLGLFGFAASRRRWVAGGVPVQS